VRGQCTRNEETLSANGIHAQNRQACELGTENQSTDGESEQRLHQQRADMRAQTTGRGRFCRGRMASQRTKGQSGRGRFCRGIVANKCRWAQNNAD
jgi:hypothetical protein